MWLQRNPVPPASMCSICPRPSCARIANSCDHFYCLLPIQWSQITFLYICHVHYVSYLISMWYTWWGWHLLTGELHCLYPYLGPDNIFFWVFFPYVFFILYVHRKNKKDVKTPKHKACKLRTMDQEPVLGKLPWRSLPSYHLLDTGIIWTTSTVRIIN